MKQMIRRLDQLENFVLVWTILGLALIGFAQVISRYVFNYSFTWYEELGRYLGVFITFSGAATGVKTGSHFTMDLVVSRINAPWKGRILCATGTTAALFFFTVAVYSCKIVTRMYGYETTSPTMQIPMYLVYLPIPVFSVLIGVRFMLRALGDLKKQAQPEAVL